MSPALIAVSGPLKGRRIDLTEPEMIIGRDKNSGLWISDLMLSRRHCAVRLAGGQCTIVDLESRNGVLVNGMPSRERDLEHADRVEIGSSLFVFVSREEEPTLSARQPEEDIEARSLKTRIAFEDATEAVASAQEHTDVLLHIAAAVSAARGTEAISKRLLEAVYEAIPARRGVVVLIYDQEQVVAAASGSGGEAISIRPGRAIVHKVVQERLSVVGNDIQTASSAERREKARDSDIHSLLCAPMMSQGTLIGFLYLDTSDPAVQFDEHHLQLASAIAAIVAPAIRSARENELLQRSLAQVQAGLQDGRRLVGEGELMKRVREQIQKVSRSDSPVLLRGEGGTGKELAARAIHDASRRAAYPFVIINCAAIPDALLESELFGHEKGAFAGAIDRKKGRLESAAGGTLFLDEVGELGLPLQSRLLRVLDDQEYTRLGDARPISIDVRILAATRRDIERMVQEGTFREDLLNRLNAIQLQMPPLREMGDDILLQAQYFASRFAGLCRRRMTGIDPGAQSILKQYEWPENTRELKNAIEQAVILGATEQILVDDLPDRLLDSSSVLLPSGKDYHNSVRDLKRHLVTKAFEGTNSNYAEAASRLGVNPNHLYRLVRHLGLKDL